jgi:uncharacterized protein YozE (UPF0346 family)
MNKKTFYQWIRKQKYGNDEVGDIAKDILLDINFPKYVRTSHKKIETYLKSKKANDYCIESFKIAWDEYKKAYM